MPNPPLIAVDTNVLLDLAANNETVLDCISTVRRKFPSAPIIIPPTVISELADIAENGDSAASINLALKALKSLRHPWGFQPMNCVPVGHGIVEETARKIRAAGLLPDEEINDSRVIAEAALANVTLLLSSDSHLKDIDQAALKEVLDGCDAGNTVIFSPRKIVKDFFKSAH